MISEELFEFAAIHPGCAFLKIKLEKVAGSGFEAIYHQFVSSNILEERKFNYLVSEKNANLAARILDFNVNLNSRTEEQNKNILRAICNFIQTHHFLKL